MYLTKLQHTLQSKGGCHVHTYVRTLCTKRAIVNNYKALSLNLKLVAVGEHDRRLERTMSCHACKMLSADLLRLVTISLRLYYFVLIGEFIVFYRLPLGMFNTHFTLSRLIAGNPLEIHVISSVSEVVFAS